jgi:hypothetical protein
MCKGARPRVLWVVVARSLQEATRRSGNGGFGGSGSIATHLGGTRRRWCQRATQAAASGEGEGKESLNERLLAHTQNIEQVVACDVPTMAKPSKILVCSGKSKVKHGRGSTAVQHRQTRFEGKKRWLRFLHKSRVEARFTERRRAHELVRRRKGTQLRKGEQRLGGGSVLT